MMGATNSLLLLNMLGSNPVSSVVFPPDNRKNPIIMIPTEMVSQIKFTFSNANCFLSIFDLNLLCFIQIFDVYSYKPVYSPISRDNRNQDTQNKNASEYDNQRLGIVKNT